VTGRRLFCGCDFATNARRCTKPSRFLLPIRRWLPALPHYTLHLSRLPAPTRNSIGMNTPRSHTTASPPVPLHRAAASPATPAGRHGRQRRTRRCGATTRRQPLRRSLPLHTGDAHIPGMLPSPHHARRPFCCGARLNQAHRGAATRAGKRRQTRYNGRPRQRRLTAVTRLPLRNSVPAPRYYRDSAAFDASLVDAARPLSYTCSLLENTTTTKTGGAGAPPSLLP